MVCYLALSMTSYVKLKSFFFIRLAAFQSEGGEETKQKHQGIRRVTTMADSEAGTLKLKTLDHIGIQVRDVEKVIETWERMFGIGPWTIREMTRTTPEGETLTTKLAFAYTDNNVEIELIQSSRNEFIDTHGEGLHHCGFFVDDVDEDAAKAVECGARVAFKGPGGNIHLAPDGPGGVRFELMGKRARVTDR